MYTYITYILVPFRRDLLLVSLHILILGIIGIPNIEIQEDCT